jgi:hypothetical protein
MFGTQGSTEPQPRLRRHWYPYRVANPIVRTMRNGLALRIIVITFSTWIATWACIGAWLYFQDPPPPYVLDREED